MPIIPKAVSPNISVKPMSENINEAIQKSTKFLMATLILFLALTRPFSRQQNPACMILTRMAQKTIQRIVRLEVIKQYLYYGWNRGMRSTIFHSRDYGCLFNRNYTGLAFLAPLSPLHFIAISMPPTLIGSEIFRYVNTGR